LKTLPLKRSISRLTSPIDPDPSFPILSIVENPSGVRIDTDKSAIFIFGATHPGLRERIYAGNRSWIWRYSSGGGAGTLALRSGASLTPQAARALASGSSFINDWRRNSFCIFLPRITVLGIPESPSSVICRMLGDRDNKEENVCSNTQCRDVHAKPWVNMRHKWCRRVFSWVLRSRRITHSSNFPKNASVNSGCAVCFLHGGSLALMVNFWMWVVIPGRERVPNMISLRRTSRSPISGD